MKKLSATAFLLSANLFLQGALWSAWQAVYGQTAPRIHHTLEKKEINFSISHWKSNSDLLALAKWDQDKVNTFIDVVASWLETLKGNARFKLLFKNYFNNNSDALVARLATIALLETDLDNTKSGALGEKWYFQILTKECKVATKSPWSQKTAKNPDPIIERIKNERWLSRLKNHDYLGIIMIMEDAADVSYTLSNEGTKDKYYQYLAADFNMIWAIILYHNKWVMLYEIIEELKNEWNNNISFQDILDRIQKKTWAKANYGESRFKWLKTSFIKLKEWWARLLAWEKCRSAVWYNYSNLGSAINTILDPQ